MKLVVDLRKVRHPAQAYVMLSRVQSSKQIFILEELDVDSLVVSEKALQEVQRLDELSRPKWVKPNNETMIIFQNIRSIQKHFEDITCESNLRFRHADVLCLSETWLSENNDGSSFEIEGLGKPQLANAGRGKGLAVYSRLGFDEHTTMKVKHTNYQILKFEYDQYVIIALYRSQCASCLDILTEILKFCDTEKLIVIGGDFNVCAITEFNNVLLNGLINAGFNQLVREATHIEGRTIDHCYVRNSTIKSQNAITEQSVSVRSVYFSDHDSVILSLSNISNQEVPA